MSQLTWVLGARSGSPIRYWRIGTRLGAEESIWPAMRDGRYVAIGWRAIGDLRNLKEDSRRTLVQDKIEKSYGSDKRVASRKAGGIVHFFATMAEGDVVVAADGQSVLGVGLVKGGYEYEESDPAEAPHRRSVAGKEMDRRTRAYEPAMTLIEILLNMEGVSLDAGIGPVAVKGFLFDMNRFFQTLLSRFLRDNLVGIQLYDERNIQQMFSYEPDKNPQHRRAPKLRPDFTVMAERQVLAVLDAKYRDLWELSLPREMLYQLALYALAREESCREAVILYPTLKEAAKEQVVCIERFSASFQLKPRVTLRPVNLLRLDRLVSGAA